MSIPATGRAGTVTGITIHRVRDGRLVEGWTNWDTLGLLQQLGIAAHPARA
jgi:predicted ester cyclase